MLLNAIEDYGRGSKMKKNSSRIKKLMKLWQKTP
jgi:hypothetical protein